MMLTSNVLPLYIYWQQLRREIRFIYKLTHNFNKPLNIYIFAFIRIKTHSFFTEILKY